MASFRLIPLLSAALVLAACSDDKPTPATATAPASVRATNPVAVPPPVKDPDQIPASPAAAAADFKIVTLVLGNGEAATKDAENKDVFAAKDTIYASVFGMGAHTTELRLSGRWSGPDGAFLAETTMPAAPNENSATSFRLTNTAPWTPGKYKVDILVNGSVAQSREFEIR